MTVQGQRYAGVARGAVALFVVAVAAVAAIVAASSSPAPLAEPSRHRPVPDAHGLAASPAGTLAPRARSRR